MFRLVDNDVAVHTASPLASQDEISPSIYGYVAFGGDVIDSSTYDNVITGYAHSLAALALCESVCTRTIFSIKGNKAAFKFAMSP